jgi:hypothetical protein
MYCSIFDKGIISDISWKTPLIFRVSPNESPSKETSPPFSLGIHSKERDPLFAEGSPTKSYSTTTFSDGSDSLSSIFTVVI